MADPTYLDISTLNISDLAQKLLGVVNTAMAEGIEAEDLGKGISTMLAMMTDDPESIDSVADYAKDLQAVFAKYKSDQPRY